MIQDKLYLTEIYLSSIIRFLSPEGVQFTSNQELHYGIIKIRLSFIS